MYFEEKLIEYLNSNMSSDKSLKLKAKCQLGKHQKIVKIFEISKVFKNGIDQMID